MPIRTAIIGLSANAATSWAASAHLPYLLSPSGRAKYEIVALCNSSVENAKKAIAHFNLPGSVRAYGNPLDLAEDKDVDLVVVSTRVDVHHETARPALQAGKAVFCEWPLAQDTKHAYELAKLAEEKGVKTVIGTQGRLAPITDKLRKVISTGRIGKITGVEARAFGGLNARDAMPKGLAYFAERKIGGNAVTIGFGHLFDTLQAIVGELSDLHGQAHLQRPTVKIFEPGTQKVIGTTTSDVPDLLLAAGRLSQSATTQKDALVQIRMQLGPSWPGESPLVVHINGEKGAIRLTFEGGMSIALSYQKPVTIEVHDFKTDKVEKVDWVWEEWQNEIPIPGRNIGALYEVYARGGGHPDFSDALHRHEQLDRLLKDFVVKSV
ncbi:hypothetical protein F5Y16DRAFT_140273 [Xylariaceae sp. FL0255]|nr:hypothetical protein F5Y16DRAFT_140273 [Xylariaceae sp. FL0255]